MVSVEWPETRLGRIHARARRDEAAASEKRHHLVRGWRTLVHWIVVAAALGYLAWRVPEMAAQFAQLDHVGWGWITLAALCAVGALAAYGELHRQLLLVGGVRLPAMTVQGVTFAQNAVSATVPVVGGAGSLGYAISQLRRRGVDAGLAAWSVLLAGVITAVVLLVLGALGLAWAGKVPAEIAVPAAIVVALGSAGVWLLLTHPKVVRRGMRVVLRAGHRPPGMCPACRRTWADRADSLARQLSARVAPLRPSAGRWASLLGVALVSWVLDYLALVASSTGTGNSASWTVLVVGFLVVQASIALQVLPGGAGLAEAGLLGVLIAAGVDAVPATATVLVYRVISWLGLSIVGWVVYAFAPHTAPMHRHDTENEQDEVLTAHAATA